MDQIFYKFKFDEENFHNECHRLSNFLALAEKLSTKITSLKQFPPCIPNISSASKMHGTYIKASNSSVIITNNLFFGDEYIKVNRLFSESPYISEKCQYCEHFKSFRCRGLMNKDFCRTKEKITHRIGDDNYKAVKSDYDSGIVITGSHCSRKCIFCFDRYIPNTILRVIPFITKEEVYHFLHYIPNPVEFLGSSYHCRSGEISESPHFHDFLPLILSFSTSLFWITNGSGLTGDTIGLLKSHNIVISLSAITFDTHWMKHVMNQNHDDNVINKIHLIRNNGISYQVNFVPLKCLIESGDIFKSFDKLFAIDPECLIRIQMPSSCKYFTKEMQKELHFDYNEFKNNIRKLYPNRKITFSDEYDANSRLESPEFQAKSFSKIESNIKKICSNKKKHLLLCPERTYDFLKGLSSVNIKTIKVISSLGYTNPCAGVLRIEDYISAINKEKDTFDIIILPRSSFDVNLNDFSLSNVNNLWKETKNISRLLLFM